MTPRYIQQELAEREAEEESLDKAAALSPHMIYEVIRRDGEEELARTKRSLFWSGIAAGILISLSVLGEESRVFFRVSRGDHGTYAAVHGEYDYHGSAGDAVALMGVFGQYVATVGYCSGGQCDGGLCGGGAVCFHVGNPERYHARHHLAVGTCDGNARSAGFLAGHSGGCYRCAYRLDVATGGSGGIFSDSHVHLADRGG